MISKIIWTLWFQGWDDAPPLVKSCARRLQEMNPDYEIRFLDNESLRSWYPQMAVPASIRGKWLTATAYSNLIRLALLDEYGGVWSDATTWHAKPLSSWLPDVPVHLNVDPLPRREIPTWLIASEVGNPLIYEWLWAAERYWEGRSAPHTYHWIDGCYREALAIKEEFQALHDGFPRFERGFGSPFRYVPYGHHFFRAWEDMDADALGGTHANASPVQKLSFHPDPKRASKESVLRRICDYATTGVLA